MRSKAVKPYSSSEFHSAGSKSDETEHLSSCPSFGITWEKTYDPFLLLPYRTEADRDTKQDAKPAAPVIDAMPEEQPVQTSVTRTEWPKPETETARLFRQIFDSVGVENNAAQVLSGVSDRDQKSRNEAVLDLMRKRGEFRLAKIPGPSWRSDLEALSLRFPSYEPVIDHLRGSCALAELEHCFCPISPILLNGPPGIGKSLFAEAVAEFLATTCVRVGFATAQANSFLVGSADYWSNTQPGEIFKALVHGEFANPIVLIDEVDKATVQHCDPTNALLPLLESTTAKQFRDLSFPWIEMDASLITWICTSNDADSLPPPLLTRVLRFDIDAPSADAAKATVERIFADLIQGFPAATSGIRLGHRAIEILAEMSPRTAKLKMRCALARAVFHKRTLIDAAEVHDEVPRGARSIGFVPLGTTTRSIR